MKQISQRKGKKTIHGGNVYLNRISNKSKDRFHSLNVNLNFAKYPYNKVQ